MVVLSKLEVETDEITIEINEKIIKVVACEDFSAQIIQYF